MDRLRACPNSVCLYLLPAYGGTRKAGASPSLQNSSARATEDRQLAGTTVVAGLRRHLPFASAKWSAVPGIYEKACVSSPKFRFFCFVFRYVSYVLTKVTLQRSGRSRYLPPPDLLSQPLTCSPLRAGPVPVSHLFVVAYCAT